MNFVGMVAVIGRGRPSCGDCGYSDGDVLIHGAQIHAIASHGCQRRAYTVSRMCLAVSKWA